MMCSYRRSMHIGDGGRPDTVKNAVPAVEKPETHKCCFPKVNAEDYMLHRFPRIYLQNSNWM